MSLPPIRVRVFVHSSRLEEGTVTTVFPSRHEAEQYGAECLATLLGRPRDSIPAGRYFEELERLNGLYRQMGEPELHVSIDACELVISPEQLLRRPLTGFRALLWRFLA